MREVITSESKGIMGEALSLYQYHRRLTPHHAGHDYRNVYLKWRRDMSRYGPDDLGGLRILDLGCGQRFPFSLLASFDGADVTALDVDDVRPGPPLVRLLRTAKHDGLRRAAKSATRRALFDKLYYGRLAEVSGGRMASPSAIRFVTSEPGSSTYPLPSDYFDLVSCNSVLEYVLNLDECAAEVARVLRSGGVFHTIIHNYYSLSGSMNMAWSNPERFVPADVPPWDHLRGNRFPSGVVLNRLRPEDYLDAFGSRLNVLLFEGRDVNHDPGGYEGESLLDTEVREELTGYPRDLLLTRAYCLIAVKPVE